MLRAPWKMDPRIREALMEQRGSIIRGLLCVAVASALTLAVLQLTRESFVQIGRATAQQVDVTQEMPSEDIVSKAFGVSVEEARERLQQAAPETGETDSERQSRQADALGKIGLLSLGVIIVFAFRYFFARGQQFFLSRAAARLSTNLRRRLYAKLMRLPLRYYGEKRLGGLQSVLTNDVNVYQNAIGLVRDSVDGPIKAVGALTFIFVTNWQLGLIALAKPSNIRSAVRFRTAVGESAKRKLPSLAPRGYVIVHGNLAEPASNEESKLSPRQLGQLLLLVRQEVLGFPILVIGQDVELLDRAELPEGILLASEFGLTQAEQLHLIQEAGLFLGMSSGPSVVALLSDTPYVVLKHERHHSLLMEAVLNEGVGASFASSNQIFLRFGDSVADAFEDAMRLLSRVQLGGLSSLAGTGEE